MAYQIQTLDRERHGWFVHLLGAWDLARAMLNRWPRVAIVDTANGAVVMVLGVGGSP